jgi:enoyl-CoA hydratase/carnithine racemase
VSRRPKVRLERDPSRDGRLAYLVLDRPEVLNAIDNELAEDLCNRCLELAEDRSVRVVIFRGEGERAFCAGADLKARHGFSQTQWLAQRALFRRTFDLVRAVPQPMIAAVHGYALGGGTELALLADLILASEDAQFGLTEVSLGIIPGGGGTQTLPRRIGPSRAKELIFSARRIPAAEALALGLANHVVPRAELLARAEGLADAFLRNSPFALRQAKWAIDQGFDLPFWDALEREHIAYMRTLESAERQEGIAAFNQKRTPRWT